MRRLLSFVLPLALGGCWSQIFLDSVPAQDVSRVAAEGASKKVYALSSNACDYPPAATSYQIRERLGRKWIQRCARVQGFAYRPGRDYLLEVKEYPAMAGPAQLVLEKVIAEWPEAKSR